MIKIFSLPSALEVEESINTWLKINNVNIINLYYCVNQMNGYEQHSILLYYTSLEGN